MSHELSDVEKMQAVLDQSQPIRSVLNYFDELREGGGIRCGLVFADEIHANAVGALSWSLYPAMLEMVPEKLEEYLGEAVAEVEFLRTKPTHVDHKHDSYEKTPFVWMVKQLNDLRLLQAFGQAIEPEAGSMLPQEFASMLQAAAEKDVAARQTMAVGNTLVAPAKRAEIVQQIAASYVEGFNAAEFARIMSETLGKNPDAPANPEVKELRMDMARILGALAKDLARSTQPDRPPLG